MHLELNTHLGQEQQRRQLICPLESWNLVAGKEYIFLTRQEGACEGPTGRNKNLLHMCGDVTGCSQDAVGIGGELGSVL